MSAHPDARIIPLQDIGAPQIHETAWVAPGAVIVGNVRLHAGASVWYNAVLRSEHPAPIEIGENSNLQDNVTCHADAPYPLTLGRGVSVGHNAVLHGCTIGDDVLIGMGARVMNGAVIGAGSLIAAGAVVLEGTVIPEGSLVAGVPGKVRRELGDDDRARIQRNSVAYVKLAQLHGA